MAEAGNVDAEETPAGRRRRGGLLIGLAAMLVLGGAGFYAAWAGLVHLPLAERADAKTAPPHAAPEGAEAASFVQVPPTVVGLGPSARAAHLRLSAALDVAPGAEAPVESLMPRILDVINTYLQALDEADVERPAAMARVRAQLLRRIRVVVGGDLVRDLLITEFVLQ